MKNVYVSDMESSWQNGWDGPIKRRGMCMGGGMAIDVKSSFKRDVLSWSAGR